MSGTIERKQKRRNQESRKRYKKQYYARTAHRGNRSKYSFKEDILVLEHQYTDTQLSDMLNRSVQSIQSRRFRLKSRSDPLELLGYKKILKNKSIIHYFKSDKSIYLNIETSAIEKAEYLNISEINACLEILLRVVNRR